MSLNPPSDTKVIDNGNYIFYNGHNYRYKDSMTSILFMGVDKDELGTVKNVVGTGGQADALYLIAIDTDNGVTTTFQISRNTMVDIDLYNTAVTLSVQKITRFVFLMLMVMAKKHQLRIQ